jgi:chromate transport protein ChrA
MNFIISFLIPALIAVAINDYIKYKIVKNQHQAEIYLACRMLVIIVLAAVSFSFIKNQLITQAAISFAVGMNVSFPRLKKKQN